MWKRTVAVTFLVGLSLLLGSRLTAETPVGPRRWITDYSLARREAERLGLPLVVHFHASWCGPCQQMEAETLSKPEVLSQLGTKFIGVKIDNDENYELVQGFRVDSLPSDIIVAPDGRIMARTSGYRPQRSYLATLHQWGDAFPKERAEAIAKLTPNSTVTPEASKPDEKTGKGFPMSELNPMNLFTNKFKPNPQPETKSEPSSTQSQQAESTVAKTESPTSDNPLIGLDGYSPVGVKRLKTWVKGRPEYSMNYQGVLYYMSDANELAQFRADPNLYAPQLLGCDPVEFTMTREAHQGSVQYAALFDGKLYLFGSIDSRNRFKVDPDRYINVRVALRADDIIGTRLR